MFLFICLSFRISIVIENSHLIILSSTPKVQNYFAQSTTNLNTHKINHVTSKLTKIIILIKKNLASIIACQYLSSQPPLSQSKGKARTRTGNLKRMHVWCYAEIQCPNRQEHKNKLMRKEERSFNVPTNKNSKQVGRKKICNGMVRWIGQGIRQRLVGPIAPILLSWFGVR